MLIDLRGKFAVIALDVKASSVVSCDVGLSVRDKPSERCCTLLESGADPRYIQELLGHKYWKTIKIYTYVNINKIGCHLDISESERYPRISI